MSALHVKYLLIGGGVASSAAAEAVRLRDRDGAMLLVGQEINRPYRRGLLSTAYLKKSVGHEGLFTLPARWFAENRVDLRTGRRAAHIDVARGSVALDDGEEVAYDKLLIATGGSARNLPVKGAELPGVLHLRTIEQADLLRHTIDKALAEGRVHPKGRGRVAVVGSGLQAVELACTLTEVGLAVELVIEGAYPWENFAGETVGKFVGKVLGEHGVTINAHGGPARFEGDGRVQRVVLNNGAAAPCDFAVVAAGIVVNKELLRGTPVRAEKAILVDEMCRTNVEDVFAAGDCAAVHDARFGKYRLSEPWDSAEITGAIAGANMAGASEKFAAVGTFEVELFGNRISGWGEAKHVERRIVRAGINGGNHGEGAVFAEVGVSGDGRVSQVIAVGTPDLQYPRLVSERVNVTGREEMLRDPAVELNGIG
jgi:NADPH-dependent 2,4-dienoyl-CoA reductase/sulfur reductase-like enzyme